MGVEGRGRADWQGTYTYSPPNTHTHRPSCKKVMDGAVNVLAMKWPEVRTMRASRIKTQRDYKYATRVYKNICRCCQG